MLATMLIPANTSKYSQQRKCHTAHDREGVQWRRWCCCCCTLRPCVYNHQRILSVNTGYSSANNHDVVQMHTAAAANNCCPPNPVCDTGCRAVNITADRQLMHVIALTMPAMLLQGCGLVTSVPTLTVSMARRAADGWIGASASPSSVS